VFVVDTNVLVHAAVHESEYHAHCRELVSGWRRGDMPWFITWSVAYEFVRVVSHPKVFRSPVSGPDAWSYIRTLLETPGVGVLVHTERHAEIARDVWNEHPELRGSDVHDLHIAILMREHGVRRLFTRDKGFGRFAFVESIDPLSVEV
jgi:toxin-antitoxin system PIN domain toxin